MPHCVTVWHNKHKPTPRATRRGTYAHPRKHSSRNRRTVGMGNGAPYPRSDRSFGSSSRTSGFSSPLAGAQAIRRHADVALPLTKPDGVSIGVFGHAGAGKSALVNAVRGVSPTSPTAATVGVGTGAESCEQFKWSEVPGVTFYDIPSRTDVPVDDYRACTRVQCRLCRGRMTHIPTSIIPSRRMHTQWLRCASSILWC